MAHRVDFSRPCPLKLNPKFDASGNYFCTHCSENVRDFTKDDSQTVIHLQAGQDHTCGTFREIYHTGVAGRMQVRLLNRLEHIRGIRKTNAKRL